MAELKEKKVLYDYQQRDLEAIFSKIEEKQTDFNLLYQLPTGGGKTVVFSEMVRRYIKEYNKKVVVLTHRIELCKQTSAVLNNFRVKNKIINSTVKELDEQDQDDYDCFVAMVETLNNRLNDEQVELDNVGLVIIDEAHYNSFNKLFKYFEHAFILGVTATPLSSNLDQPMRRNYDDLIVGESISSLIEKGYLARAKTFNYDVGLGTLKVGPNGDYTVSSSDDLYTSMSMQEKLVNAYEDHCKGAKTLIFNNGIAASWHVFELFKEAGYPIRHLDNTHSKEQRKEILSWFKHTPDAILTSVSILTTGFDEPTVRSIILNRATRSLTLYHQMIGRGSRKLPNKDEFTVVDLGNNIARFGPWESPMNWPYIFAYPDQFLDNMITDEDIERNFIYKMPPELRAQFSNTENVEFDMKRVYKKVIAEGKKAKAALDISIAQHAKMCAENSEDVFDARILAKELKDDIAERVRKYSYCIINNTKNYKTWLFEDYNRKLRQRINELFMD
ncbi:DEAD/DEAH box helicase family protein [Gangjinia marincola]|uniref:DEAD/DEAH box helicase family protein n=1 Tax=Gangjinia marincola TaxID=578463 RepID=A0ABN1MDK9_9FLAO